MTQHEIRTFVVISTAHVTAETARLLDNTPIKEWCCAGGPYGDYGWFVYAHEVNCDPGPDAIPDDLFGVMTWARKQGFDYILLDRDGNRVAELPSYEW